MTNGLNNHPRTREQRAVAARVFWIFVGFATLVIVVVTLVAHVWFDG